jgi:hypothetical protein
MKYIESLAYKASHACERIGMWFLHKSQDLQWWADRHVGEKK